MSIGSLRIGVPSPTAASLGKFGDIPVNLYTGTPNIEIPLYTVHGRTLQLPITLRYHASGIKVEEIAGWVGLGWALDAGGVITRTVKGLPDDIQDRGYYYKGSVLEQHGEILPSEVINDIKSETLDPEPDIFLLNVAGRTGKFFITSNQKVRTVPRQKLHFDFNFGNILFENRLENQIVEWIITTEDGTRYIFSEVEITKDLSSGSSFDVYVSSWYLTRIESPDGEDKIEFIYETTQPNPIHEQHFYEEKYVPGGCQLVDSSIQHSQFKYERKYLSEIKTSRESILFERTNQARLDASYEYALSKIIIRSSGELGNEEKKRFLFTYDYFNPQSSDAKRLKLTELKEVGDDQQTENPPYKFSYAESPALPERLSKGIDHWGYFNGKTDNTTLIPKTVYKDFTNNYKTFDGGNRNPDPQYSQSGILTKIEYPTRGHTEFIYESNDYSKIGNEWLQYDQSEEKEQTASSSHGIPSTEPFELVSKPGTPIQVTVELDFFVADGHNPDDVKVEIRKGGNMIKWFKPGDEDDDNIPKEFFLDPGNYELYATTPESVGDQAESIAMIKVKWHDLEGAKIKTAGGVRIKEIIDYDGMGYNYVKKYQYRLVNQQDRSSGVVVNEKRYYYKGTCMTGAYISFSAMSYVSPGITQGCPVGYSEVKVTHGHYDSEINFIKLGETLHRYTTAENHPDLIGAGAYEEFWPFGHRISYDWRRGRETELIKSSWINIEDKEKRETQYEYVEISPNGGDDFTVAYNVKFSAVEEGGSVGYSRRYLLFSEWHYMKKDETNPMSNTATGYNNVHLTGIRRIVGSINLENRYKYHLHGNIKEHIDENGKTWKYDYDPFGRLEEAKGPDNQIKKEISYILTGANFGQNNPNFIETVHRRTSSESVITKTFFDGLGDEIQQLVRYGSQDIIQTAITYDGRRRQHRLYKPYQKSGSGGYDSSFHNNANNYYNAIDTPGSRTQGYPYSETEYMPDPLDRVKRQSHPGAVYRMGEGKEIKHEYWTSNGAHLRNRIIDENGQVTDTYIDKFGNTIETRVDPSGLNIQTRMEYDAMGNMTKVTDPRNLVTTYKYNTMGLLREKTSPDAGTVKKLYDRAGNLRFVQDANHSGSQPNDVNISGNVSSSGTSGDQFTLNMPGSVEVNTEGSFNPASGNESYLYVRIKASNGTPILTVYCHAGQKVQNGKIKLPRGNYQYEIESYIQPGTSASFSFSIHCQKQYEFIYYKYDKHNRMLEVGEYKSTSLGNFTQANADNPDFTDSSSDRSRELYYDEPSDEAVDGGGAAQRNLKGRLSYAVSRRLGKKAVTVFYSYDDDGRVEWIRYKGLGDSMKEIQYTYDRQDNITQKEYRDLGNGPRNLTCTYEYDTAGRLVQVKNTHSGVSNKTEAEYTYFPTGQPRRLVLGSPRAQGVDFRYNTRDWLIYINHQNLTQTAPSQDNNDRFGLVIGYDQVGHIGSAQGAQAQYNGNIGWLMYAMHGVSFSGPEGATQLIGYSFGYDKANRLLKGDFGYYANGAWRPTNAYDEKEITYHKNGNITALKRYNQSGNLLHNYTYNYYENTNRLRRVTGSGNNYAYDNNGNMIQDLANGIGFVIYDIHNLPVRVFTTNGAPRDYAYDHEGNRVRTYNGVKTNYYINGIDGRTEVVTDKASAWATYNLYGLDAIGQIRRSGSTWNRFYFLKDHLGSVRVIVDASGNVVAYDDYYPFGMQMPGRTQDSAAVDGRYKFTGKERDTETKYDYFGARYYDSRIGRFLIVDPLTDDARLLGWSPYHYGYDNPLRFIDIKGMQPDDNEERERERLRKAREAAERARRTSIEHLKRAITISPGVSLGVGLRFRKGLFKVQFMGTLKQVEHRINLEEGKNIKESRGLSLEVSFRGIGFKIGRDEYIVRDELGEVQEIYRDTGPLVKAGVIGPVELSKESIEVGGYLLQGLSIDLNVVELAKSIYYNALSKIERTKDPEYLKMIQTGGSK